MYPSPYDENWNLDMLAAETQLNHPQTYSIFTTNHTEKVSRCGGCGAELTGERIDDHGRSVRTFACGHRYTIGQRTVSIERA